jgi:hypothetical protein
VGVLAQAAVVILAAAVPLAVGRSESELCLTDSSPFSNTAG